jgi:hypothetical protein
VIGWASRNRGTTKAVDAALGTRNAGAINELGRKGKLAWCELSCRRFSYTRFWRKFRDELDEYEKSVGPKKLAAFKAAKTRYALRSGLRPRQCAEFLGDLCDVLKSASNGVVE